MFNKTRAASAATCTRDAAECTDPSCYHWTATFAAATTTTAMLCIDPFCESHGKHSHAITLDVVSDADVISIRSDDPSEQVRMEVAAALDATSRSEVAVWRSEDRKARSLAARREAAERAHSALHEHASSLMRQLDVQAQVVEELQRRVDAERAWERELERITYSAQSAADKALNKVVRLHA